MAAPHTGSLVPALVVPYLVWRVYRRFHRNVGRQVVHAGRLIWGIAFFGAAAAGLLALTLPVPAMRLGLGGGLVLGALLALVGLHLTKFETSQAKPHYYTPNTYIGMALTLLLAGRVLYRMGMLYFTDSLTMPVSPSVIQSPLTVFLVGLTAGYYIAFNSGVLFHSRRKM